MIMAFLPFVFLAHEWLIKDYIYGNGSVDTCFVLGLNQVQQMEVYLHTQ